MKAIAKVKKTEGVEMIDAPKPACGPDDVLVRVKYTGICGTDVHIYNWDEWAQKTIPAPMIIGHEFVGEIAEVGSNVTRYKKGEIVSAEGHIVCGHCRACMAGQRHLCANTVGIGVHRDGAFAEYISVPATNIWRTSPDIPEELYAIFDPLGNAAHTALSFDLVGEDVLITGAGPIGCMAVGMAQKSGARKVIVTDVNEYRLDLARKMGATQAVNVAKENLKDVMKRQGMTEGFDVGLEMSGNAQGFRQMIDTLRPGAKIAMLGIQPGDTTIDWGQFVFKGLLLKGIYGREMYETWYKLTAMLQSGLDVSPIITHRFHYTEFQKGFDVMRSGKSGKVVLQWS